MKKTRTSPNRGFTHIFRLLVLVIVPLFFYSHLFAFDPLRQKGDPLALRSGVVLVSQDGSHPSDLTGKYNLSRPGAMVIPLFLTVILLFFALLGTKKRQLKRIVDKDRIMINKDNEILYNSFGKLRMIFDTADDFVFIKDTTGKFVEVNPVLERRFNLDRALLIGRSHEEIPFFNAMKAKSASIDETDKMVLKGETVRYELTQSLGEEVLVLDVIKAPLCDEEGEIRGIYGIARDITSHRETENQLRESERRFRELVEMLPLSVCEVNSDMLVTYANKTALNTFAYTTADLENGVSLALAIIPEDIEKAAKDLEKVMSGKSIGGREYTLVKKDGQVFPSVVYGAAMMKGDRPVGVRVIIIDVTAQKQLEKEREITGKRFAQLERLEAIGTLAGGVAHDFNNLLMGIQGYTSLVIKDLTTAHPHYERLKNIEDLVNSGANLTAQLLGFARGGQYEVKVTHIREIITRTAAVFGQTKKEISIDCKCMENICPVEVDRGQMEQVFMNLFVNAWHAMPAGGNILIGSENVIVDEKTAFTHSVSPGKFVRVSVTDTGIGMDDKTKQHIFEPFFTTRKMGRGTGLGLSTVYGILKNHKGFITVDSSPGCGTTFCIYLPASDKKPLEEKKGTAKGEIFQGTETILVVDDEKSVLETNCELLESLGYHVFPAGSGQEALSVYMEKKNDIDLVILDMIMPGISGRETFDRLLQINPHVLVLLSSGYSLNEEVKSIMKRGCRGYIKKPFRLEELSQKVYEMLAEGEKPEILHK